jgi:hypothetical protein
MGNEDPWFLLVGGALAFLLLAAMAFIPIKITLLLLREQRKKRDG